MGVVARPFLTLAVLILAFLAYPLSACARSSMTACAIRWDAWYSNGVSDPGHYTALTLSKPEWRDRTPLHAQVDPVGRIIWAPSQRTFDAEIRAAHSSNLCWAYLMYGSNNIIDLGNPMMQGLRFHRASAIRDSVKYAMIITSGLIGQGNNYQTAIAATVSLMHDGNYQRVVIHRSARPLLFLLYDPQDLMSLFQGSLVKMKVVIDALRTASKRDGLGNPYIVIVHSPASAAEDVRRALGADAISEYVSGARRGDPQSWASFAPTITADWNSTLAVTSADFIPTLRTGADIRARCQTPPPWDHRFKVYHCDSFVFNPTIRELMLEFRSAIAWIENHSARDPAKLSLVYSWSECDESGNCLMPTIGDPKGLKLHSLSLVLGQN